jgi:hypothetical protein
MAPSPALCPRSLLGARGIEHESAAVARQRLDVPLRCQGLPLALGIAASLIIGREQEVVKTSLV